MQVNNNSKKLLLVLGVMLVARFILIPIIEWQDDMIAENESLSKRLTKIDNVLFNEEVIALNLSKVKNTNSALQQNYFIASDVEAFKLKQQQVLEQKFENHKLKIKGINWIANIPGDVSEHRLKITFQGKTKHLAQMQMELVQQSPYIDVTEWVIRLKQNNQTSMGLANGYVMLTFFSTDNKKGLQK